MLSMRARPAAQLELGDLAQPSAEEKPKRIHEWWWESNACVVSDVQGSVLSISYSLAHGSVDVADNVRDRVKLFPRLRAGAVDRWLESEQTTWRNLIGSTKN